MKTIIALLIFVGCNKSEGLDGLNERLLYDSKIADGWGTFGVDDSTLICYQTFRGLTDTQWIKFTYDPKHFWDAHNVVDGYLFGFYRMNLMSQKDYVEKLQYVHTGVWAETRAELDDPNHTVAHSGILHPSGGK